jgi:hypothetical protein
MGDYYVPITEILINAGCQVHVDDSNAGWETRSRSSGGFNGPPLAVQWHHTASNASVDNDLSYMIHGSPDEPVGNVLLDRNGVFHPVAAGAANTSGKGGPNKFSRGTVAKDSGNTSIFSIEIANDGVGQRYSQVQIDAAFLGSNALNAAFGNQPDDVIPHSIAEGTGYTDRKIDPATNNVEGPWVPRSVNSSKTWSHADLKAECLARAGTLPPPTEPTEPPSTTDKEIDMLALDFGNPPGGSEPADSWWTRLTYCGDTLVHVKAPADQLQARGKVPIVPISEEELKALLVNVTTVGDSPFGPGQAPNPDLDAAWAKARGRT